MLNADRVRLQSHDLQSDHLLVPIDSRACASVGKTILTSRLYMYLF